MKKMLASLAAGAAMISSVAQADIYVQPNTVYTFSGPVAVEKDAGTFYCTLELTITTGSNEAPDVHGTWAHAHSATATAELSGPSPCEYIAVEGVADVDVTSGGEIIFDGFSVVPPVSGGYCDGPIVALWNGTTVPSITVSSPLSDMDGGCKLVGTVSQVSGSPLEVYGD